MLFLHIQYWFTWQSRSQIPRTHPPPPPQKRNQHLKLKRVLLTLESHFHRNWSAKNQGNALKSVSFKMFILPCFCWSKCCYHRNRRSSWTSHGELGATSLICRSARPAASQALQVEISTAAGTDLCLLALQLRGKTRLRRPFLQNRLFYAMFGWKIH